MTTARSSRSGTTRAGNRDVGGMRERSAERPTRFGPLPVGQSVIVGRHPGRGGLRVADPRRRVSRRHLVLTRTASDGVILRDISKNGCAVSGRRTRPDHDLPLNPGAVVKFPGAGGALTLGDDFTLLVAPRRPTRSTPVPAWLQAAHKTLVGGPEYATSGSWRHSTAGPNQGTPWKIHIYADSPADWLRVARVVLPYLQECPVYHKTVKNLNVFARKLNGTKQEGKAFTVYFATVPAMKRAARDLHAVLREHGLERRGLGIFGDRQLGTTGRLFYRYDEDSKGNPRRNDGRYMPPGIRRDPFKPLSGSLQ